MPVSKSQAREPADQLVPRLDLHDALLLLMVLEMPPGVRSELVNVIGQSEGDRFIAQVVLEAESDPTGVVRARLIQGLNLAIAHGST